MHFLYLVYYELTACTCFEHYLLIFRRRCINNSWYTAGVLCRLVARNMYRLLIHNKLNKKMHLVGSTVVIKWAKFTVL
jgi:hypothetical protein